MNTNKYSIIALKNNLNYCFDDSTDWLFINYIISTSSIILEVEMPSDELHKRLYTGFNDINRALYGLHSYAYPEKMVVFHIAFSKYEIISNNNEDYIVKLFFDINQIQND